MLREGARGLQSERQTPTRAEGGDGVSAACIAPSSQEPLSASHDLSLRSDGAEQPVSSAGTAPGAAPDGAGAVQEGGTGTDAAAVQERLPLSELLRMVRELLKPQSRLASQVVRVLSDSPALAPAASEMHASQPSALEASQAAGSDAPPPPPAASRGPPVPRSSDVAPTEEVTSALRALASRLAAAAPPPPAPPWHVAVRAVTDTGQYWAGRRGASFVTVSSEDGSGGEGDGDSAADAVVSEESWLERASPGADMPAGQSGGGGSGGDGSGGSGGNGGSGGSGGSGGAWDGITGGVSDEGSLRHQAMLGAALAAGQSSSGGSGGSGGGWEGVVTGVIAGEHGTQQAPPSTRFAAGQGSSSGSGGNGVARDPATDADLQQQQQQQQQQQHQQQHQQHQQQLQQTPHVSTHAVEPGSGSGGGGDGGGDGGGGMQGAGPQALQRRDEDAGDGGQRGTDLGARARELEPHAVDGGRGLRLPLPAHCVLVDPAFRECFATPYMTPRYRQVWSSLPETFVGHPSSQLLPLVKLASYELRLDFESRGVPLPPWRTRSCLLARWLSPWCMEEEVPWPAEGGPPSPQPP